MSQKFQTLGLGYALIEFIALQHHFYRTISNMPKHSYLHLTETSHHVEVMRGCIDKKQLHLITRLGCGFNCRNKTCCSIRWCKRKQIGNKKLAVFNWITKHGWNNCVSSLVLMLIQKLEHSGKGCFFKDVEYWVSAQPHSPPCIGCPVN